MIPGIEDDYEEHEDENGEEALAAWEALLLPDWRWEALEKEDDGLYYGRVKSPKTYDQWEYGYFTEEELREAGAYRVDTSIDEGELFLDGGQELADVYETELNALQYLEPQEEEDDEG